MHMGSREMLLMDLFAESNADADIKNRLGDTVREGGGQQTERIVWKHVHYCT